MHQLLDSSRLYARHHLHLCAHPVAISALSLPLSLGWLMSLGQPSVSHLSSLGWNWAEARASYLRVLDLLWSSFGLSEVHVPSTPMLNSVRGDRITENFIFSDKTQARLCWVPKLLPFRHEIGELGPQCPLRKRDFPQPSGLSIQPFKWSSCWTQRGCNFPPIVL